MTPPESTKTSDGRSSVRGMVATLCFGVAILAYLVAIDRVSWREPGVAAGGGLLHAVHARAAIAKT